MSFEITGRFAGLLEAGQTVTATRTAAGKRRSAMNAVKHALYTAACMPDETNIDDCRLYKKAYAQFVEEFRPRQLYTSGCGCGFGGGLCEPVKGEEA